MTRSVKPLQTQRMDLSFRAVMIRGLNEEGSVVCTASGFIRRDEEGLWLYTCWHVVTGYDPNDVRIQSSLPNRVTLEILMQDAVVRQSGAESVGGLQSLIIPLYDTATEPNSPLWLQDKRHVPNQDLNGINIFVPFWHDAVKILLPETTRVSDLQVIEHDNVFPQNTLLSVGDKVYVVGYPYGYSPSGVGQPTPVVLTRFVASAHIGNRHQKVLLDGYGAHCMSGGPVFVERDGQITLLGLYTGLLYPDHHAKERNMVTALGTCSNMGLHLRGALAFVQSPDES